jgi:hypothetical protein
MLKDHYLKLSSSERRIFWIILVLAIILAVFASTVFDTFFDAPNLQYRLVNALPTLLSIISFISAGLIFNGKKEFGSWVLLIGSLIGLLTAVSQAEGYGLPSAFVLLAITFIVPIQILKGRKSLIALAIGLIGTISILLVDTFWTSARVPALASDVTSARIASVVLGLIVLVAVSIQYRELSIRSKLLILSLGTGLASIILVASSTTYFTQQKFREQTKETLTAAAHQSMEQIDSFISYSTYQLTGDAQIPDLLAFLKASSENQGELLDKTAALLNALSQSDPVNISSYALLDKNGVDVVDTFTQDIGLNKSDRDYFIIPLTKGTTYVTPVRFSPTSGESVFYIGTPIYAEDGSILGVLRIRYRSTILQQILRDNNGFAGEKSYGMLVDEYNIVLANGINPAWKYRTLTQLDPETYNFLRSEDR